MARTIHRRWGLKAVTWVSGSVLIVAACHLLGCQGAPPRRNAPPPPGANMKPYTEKIPGTDVAFDMVPIRGGKFVMGSPASEPNRSEDEGPQFEVELAPFWMGKCEVTWAEFELWGLDLDRHRRATTQAARTDRDRQADAVTRATPPYGDPSFRMGRGKHPAISLSQLAAKMYCKWLSAKTGRWYRLPTEAEWEYACRAGTRTTYSFGNDPKLLGQYAWHVGNSQEKYHLVGGKKPNPWGLHDMHGNVAEWVLDAYSPKGYARFAGKPTRSPLAVATEIHPRVVRGGSWRDGAKMLRSAARRASGPQFSARDPQIPQSIWWHTDADFVGFRVVRPLAKPTPEQVARYGLDKIQKVELEDDLIRRDL